MYVYMCRLESTSSIIPKSHPLRFYCDNVLWPGLTDCARLAGGALQGAACLCLPTAGTASMQFQVWFYFNFFFFRMWAWGLCSGPHVYMGGTLPNESTMVNLYYKPDWLEIPMPLGESVRDFQRE